jgi:hypothetical protein
MNPSDQHSPQEERLIASLKELGTIDPDPAAEVRVWNRLNQPGARPRQLLRFAVVIAGILFGLWTVSSEEEGEVTEKTADEEPFDVDDLREDEFALELYGALVVGGYDSVTAISALDDGRLPVREETPEVIEDESLTGAHPMDEILLTYQSNLTGQGLLQINLNEGDW